MIVESIRARRSCPYFSALSRNQSAEKNSPFCVSTERDDVIIKAKMRKHKRSMYRHFDALFKQDVRLCDQRNGNRLCDSAASLPKNRARKKIKKKDIMRLLPSIKPTLPKFPPVTKPAPTKSATIRRALKSCGRTRATNTPKRADACSYAGNGTVNIILTIPFPCPK